MKHIFPILLGLSFLFTASSICAQQPSQAEHDLKREVQSILSGLSGNLDRFELFQKKLEASGRNNKGYDENKNIWLSTVLAVQALSSICENEQDLLHLFWDLKKHRRSYYYDVRVKSLSASIVQIKIMLAQIHINHRLLPPDLSEIDLFSNINKKADSTVELLEQSIRLINKIRPPQSP